MNFLIYSDSVVKLSSAPTSFKSWCATHFHKCFRSLSSVTAPRLGALCVEEALKRANVEKSAVSQVYMGCVLPAGMGQAPDRQAALFAGLPTSVPCTMINKVNFYEMSKNLCRLNSLDRKIASSYISTSVSLCLALNNRNRLEYA